MFTYIRQSLRLKIFAGFAFIFLSVIAFGVSEARSLGRVIVDFELAQTYTRRTIEPLVSLQAKVLLYAMPVNDFLITGDAVERARFQRMTADLNADFAALNSAGLTANGRRELAASEKLWRSANILGLSLFKTRYALRAPEGAARMRLFDHKIVLTVDRLKLAQLTQTKLVEAQLATAKRERWRANLLIAIIWILTPTVSIVAALWLSRSILRPIKTLQDGARKFAQGDLDYEVPLPSGDEFEALAGEFNLMARRLKKSRDILHRLAIRDGLTGLYNHREFHRLLRQEVERSKRSQEVLSLLMIDIDHFKVFNDTYGHKQGDKVLKLISRLIRGQIRNIDLSARYGGEEFAVILPGATAEEAAVIAERIRASVATEPLILSGEVVQLSVSIGVAELYSKAKDAAALVDAADKALYAAKRTGRDRVAFT